MLRYWKIVPFKQRNANQDFVHTCLFLYVLMQLPHNLWTSTAFVWCFLSKWYIWNVDVEREFLKNAVTAKQALSFICKGYYLEANAHICTLKVNCSSVSLKTWVDNIDQDRHLKPEGLCCNLCDLGAVTCPGLWASLWWDDSVIGWAKTPVAKERGKGGRGLHISVDSFKSRYNTWWLFNIQLFSWIKKSFAQTCSSNPHWVNLPSTETTQLCWLKSIVCDFLCNYRTSSFSPLSQSQGHAF